ncbi:hypothetical protein ACIQXA_08705 [Streptomyces massasporeus]|uniref:hypothetical protein n=1 Tax=Streptomyces massasporeus TaxID=67324 RepID=UPI0037F2F04A
MTGMPFQVKVWVEDCDSGDFNVYVDAELVSEPGARDLEMVLNTTITGWRRLDDDAVYATLRAVTG